MQYQERGAQTRNARLQIYLKCSKELGLDLLESSAYIIGPMNIRLSHGSYFRNDDKTEGLDRSSPSRCKVISNPLRQSSLLKRPSLLVDFTQNSFGNERIDTVIVPVEKLESQMKQALEASELHLSLTPFHPHDASNLVVALEKNEKELQTLLHQIGDEQSNSLQQFRKKLTEQCQHISLKKEALNQYVKHDPFTEQNLLYPRKIYAEAFFILGQRVLNMIDLDIANAIKQGSGETFNSSAQVSALQQQHEDLKNQINAWYEQEITAYKEAKQERLKEPAVYFSPTNRNSPLLLFTKERALKELKKCCASCGIHQMRTSFLNTGAMNDSALQAMNEVAEWEVIKRDITISFNGQLKHFRQISTPMSQSESVPGIAMREQKVHGIVPATRADGRFPINARTTQLIEIHADGTEGALLHKRQEHGIVDHFDLQEGRRVAANKNSAQQLLDEAIALEPDFITEALAKEYNPLDPSKIYYINLNLTTPTYLPRGEKHNERVFSDNQGAAFRKVSGDKKTINIINKGQVKSLQADVSFVDLRFPVNYALDILDPGLFWSNIHEHNKQQLLLLFGSLDLKAPIGGLLEMTYKKLKRLSLDENSPNKERATQLTKEIESECEHVRWMFYSKSYQSAVDEDRFKMPRHIDLLVNKLRQAVGLIEDKKLCIVNAGGCMSAKDREGLMNAEAEAAAVMQSMGGSITPGQEFSKEAQAVYNSFVTLVVDNTRQVTGFAGCKNAKDVDSRIQDTDALLYASGTSRYAST